MKHKWFLFVTHGYDAPKPKPGPRVNSSRILSEEDVDYVRQLVSINPTIYRSEIRDLLLENTNSAFNDISLSTVKRTVRHRLSADAKPWTRKKTQRSNLNRWTDHNLIYTRTFLRHVSTLDVYSIRFMDESSFHINTGVRLYGSALRGERAVDISKHYVGPNYTLFYLAGLLDKAYCKITTGPSTTLDFIDFIHEACEARNSRGEPVISPGCTIIADNAAIHGGLADRVLTPYLVERNVTLCRLPKYSCDLQPLETAFSLIKRQMARPYFQRLVQYSVPLAVMESVELIDHEKMYKFFKGVSGNYMNL